MLPMPLDGIRVHHGGGKPGPGGPVVKLWRMQQYFPDHRYRYNIIYSVSGGVPAKTCRQAQARGVKVICHVNSVFHPALWPDYAELNEPIAEVYALADYVVYGSRHARVGADRYLGTTTAPNAFIYNALDTNRFKPYEHRKPGRFHVLAIGVHLFLCRLEPIIRCMPYILKHYPQVRLLIAGPFRGGKGIYDSTRRGIEGIIRKLCLDCVEFIPEFTQYEAPSVYARGDVYVNIKHMDWTPNAAIEAMACGLPVVHAGNGGMNELVGQAGVSLGMPFDWDRVHVADPEGLAQSIIEAYERRKELGQIGRNMAVERYDMSVWINSHRRLFEKLLSG